MTREFSVGVANAERAGNIIALRLVRHQGNAAEDSRSRPCRVRPPQQPPDPGGSKTGSGSADFLDKTQQGTALPGGGRCGCSG